MRREKLPVSPPHSLARYESLPPDTNLQEGLVVAIKPSLLSRASFSTHIQLYIYAFFPPIFAKSHFAENDKVERQRQRRGSEYRTGLRPPCTPASTGEKP
jgi:hypothetical protein